MPAPDPAFVAYHRAERRRVFAVAAGWALAAGAVASGFVLLGSVTAVPAAAKTSELAAISTSGGSGADAAAASLTASPTDVPGGVPSEAPTAIAVPAPASSAPAALPVTASAPRQTAYSITVTASGYQAQLDQCQWVRMDLTGTAPIVGAHTTCGGRIVLQMQAGDTVQLTGQGLDGSYRVIDSRNAHAGDDAAAATAGMDARVILQTCYYGTTGAERLIGLAPAG